MGSGPPFLANFRYSFDQNQSLPKLKVSNLKFAEFFSAVIFAVIFVNRNFAPPCSFSGGGVEPQKIRPTAKQPHGSSVIQNAQKNEESVPPAISERGR